MPYQAKEDDRCPASKPWGVTKTTDGTLMGCHANREGAMDQVAALYANEPEADAEPTSDIEQREIEADLEWRADDDTITFSGYAAVFNSPSRPMPFVETVAPGAFTRSLGSDRNVKLLVDHNPERLLASQKAKTLRLAEDDKGLHVEANLAPTSYARDLRVLAERGEIRSMSFAFKPVKGGEQWSPDGAARTLTDVRLFEVSILTGNAPAYPATTAFVRALSHQLEESEDALADAVLALAEGRELDDEQHRLLMEAITNLRPAAPEPLPPIITREQVRRRLTLLADPV